METNSGVGSAVSTLAIQVNDRGCQTGCRKGVESGVKVCTHAARGLVVDTSQGGKSAKNRRILFPSLFLDALLKLIEIGSNK